MFQAFKKTIVRVTIVSLVIWSFGIHLFPFRLEVKEAYAVSGVTGTDADTTGSGLDGRDFSISWTPAGATPDGYTSTKIYVVPVTLTALSSSVPSTIYTACTSNPGNVCADLAFLDIYTVSSFILPQFVTKDSNNTAWNAGTTYKACIYVQADSPTLTCSGGFTVTSDSVADTAPPFIDHLPVHTAFASTTAVFSANIFDDQTTAAQFADTGDGGAEYIKLFYGAVVSVSESSSTATQLGGALFQMSIATSSVPAVGSTLEYYMVANDRSNNTEYFCNDYNASTQAACRTNPFIVRNVVAAGTISVSGTITSGGAALANVAVTAQGFAKAAVITNASGTYIISGLPNNTVVDIQAAKEGYCPNGRSESIGLSNLTGIDLSLNLGDCFFGGGGDGGSGKPHVMFSGPPDFSDFVPLNETIRVGFDQPLDISTVLATPSTTNVYLTPDDGTTKVAGVVAYCASSSDPGCSALFPGDQNVILFDPTSDLTTNTFYTFVIIEGVKSQTGQSVEGNRPGGGHLIRFNTGGGTVSFDGSTFGTGGSFMPAYVESTMPAPGISIAPNSKVVLTFNTTMDNTTLTSSNIKIFTAAGSPVAISVSVDSANRTVTITPSASLGSGEYEVRVLGAVANASGVTMLPPGSGSNVAFSIFFNVSGSNDTTAPTVYPSLADGSTNVPVNQGMFEFGFNETLNPNTITTSNVTMKRGSTDVATSVKYETGMNSVFVIPNSVLAPNTNYTITFGTGVQDLAGNALASAQNFTYTTGSSDTVLPKLFDARCDDFSCSAFFNESMNSKTQVDGASQFAKSVLNHANVNLQIETAVGSGIYGTDILDASSTASYSYDAIDKRLEVKNLGLTYTDAGKKFKLTMATTTTDISSNGIDATGGINIFIGMLEDSRQTFGDFGGGTMFGPPKDFYGDGGSGAGEFKPEGFGDFTAEQFAFGQADMAFPFNAMASQDSNVFQVRFTPGAALQNDDQVVLTFPSGTTIDNAVPDTFSPFYPDFNEAFGSSTVTFDSAYDTDGVAVDATARTVTVQLGITGGSTGSNDHFTIDLRKIVNPAIPKGPETGGYTVGIKVKRSGEVIVNKTSMPYFIMAGGTNTITVKVYAGTVDTGTVGADGDVFMFAGGPAGPLDKNVTLTDGIATAADGTAIAGDAGVVYSNLPDGCYFFGTVPFVTLGGSDYFGQASPDPLCVNGGQSLTKKITLTAASGASAAALTVKLAGIANFGGVDIDIFAGGPGNFVVKTITNVTSTNPSGYTLRLPQNGMWFVGVGPAMPKGLSTKPPTALPGVPPPPIDLSVSGIGGTPAITTGFKSSPGVAFDDSADTVTFTFAAADKTVSGTVTDGVSGLANIQVFMHSQGFGAPTFATTNSTGAFSMSVSDYGMYEIGAFKDGLPPVFSNLEIRADGADAGTDPDIYFKGKQITGGNPLVIKLKKPAFTISGKVLDANGNGIAYAPVFGIDANGNFVGGGTGSDGSYTVFVDAGTWTLKSEMPPGKSDACGTFSKTVIVTTANKTSQNISPTTSTCYTLTGTISVGGTGVANSPVFVEEWDTVNSRPAAGASFKHSSTNSSGVYEVQVAGGAKYRVGTWSPDYGELSSITSSAVSANTTLNITEATTRDIVFTFTNGSSTMSAFVEVNQTGDLNKRKGQQKTGLDSTLTLTVPDGTYTYLVDVFGIGKFSGSVPANGAVTVDLSGITLVTLSGNVKDSNDTNLTGALVTIKDTTTGLIQTGTTNSSGNYSMSVKSGTYEVNSNLAQYIPGQAPETVVLSADTANYDFGGDNPDQTALSPTDAVITGTVFQSDGSTKVSTGFVTATNDNGIAVTAAVDPQSGSYSLPIIDGTWTVKAVAPLHAKTTLSSTVGVSGADVSGKNVTLTSDTTKSSKTSSSSIAANTGGSMNDMTNTGIKMTAGAGVLESGSSNVTVSVEKTFTAPDTGTYTPISNASFGISAQSSNTIKNLNGNIEIQIDYTSMVADLPAGIDEGELMLAYYSPEKGEYVPVEGGFAIDETNNIVTGQVDHLTDFALIAPSSLLAPDTPTGLSATATGTSQADLTWTQTSGATSYDIYRSTTSNGTFARIGDEPTVSSGSTVSYSDTGLSAGTIYYYKISALNTNGESAASSAVSTTTAAASSSSSGGGGFIYMTPAAGSATQTTTQTTTDTTSATPQETPEASQPATSATQGTADRLAQVQRIISEAVTLVGAQINDLLALLNAKRDLGKEVEYSNSVVTKVIGPMSPLAEVRYAIVNFVTYGTPESVQLGAGERAGVVNSFKSAFNKLPETSSDWEDVLKISVGRWPIQRSSAKENAAVASFKKIYKRDPVRSYNHDDAAVVIMAYGLRPTARNLDSEKSAILSYRHIYKESPKTAEEWDIVRAIAYSGAKREAPPVQDIVVAGSEQSLPSAEFSRDLNLGMEGEDVSRLQQLLATDHDVYPIGLVTGYFGELTQEAVQSFQLKYGVVASVDATGYGRVGPATREKLRELFGT